MPTSARVYLLLMCIGVWLSLPERSIAQATAWLPSPNEIADAERVIKMPVGAEKPITAYKRYYTGISRNGAKIIWGVFELVDSEPGISIVPRDRMPIIFDAGCAIVTVEYQADTRSVLTIRCNGVA